MAIGKFWYYSLADLAIDTAVHSMLYLISTDQHPNKTITYRVMHYETIATLS